MLYAFIVKTWRRFTESRKKKAKKKQLSKEFIEEKKKYWDCSKGLEDAIRAANRQMDFTLDVDYNFKTSDYPVLSRLTYQVDERLRLEIQSIDTGTVPSVAHEALFFIDNIPVELDFKKDWVSRFENLIDITCDSLLERVNEYKAKKDKTFDNYMTWKKEKKDGNRAAKD